MRGFLTRVGISSGEIYHYEKMVFGNALVEAVNNEKKAINPLIYVEDTYFENVDGFNEALDESLERIIKNILEPFKDGYIANFVKLAFETMNRKILSKIYIQQYTTITYCSTYYSFWAGLLYILEEERKTCEERAIRKIDYLIETIHNLDETVFYSIIEKVDNIPVQLKFSFSTFKSEQETHIFTCYEMLTKYTEKENMDFVGRTFKKIK